MFGSSFDRVKISISAAFVEFFFLTVLIPQEWMSALWETLIFRGLMLVIFI